MPVPFALIGEIDLANAEAIGEQILEHFAHADPGRDVVLDCNDLDFIDSSGLTMLVTVGHRTERRIVLKGLSDSCRRMFEVTGLDEVFVIE